MTSSDDWLQSMDPQWLRNSEDLSALVTWAVENLDLDLGGQVSRRVEVEDRRLIFLWHATSPAGELSPVQQELTARGCRSGITVEFEPCPFNMQQIRAAVERLADTAGEVSWRGFVLSSIAGPTEEFLGLTIDGYLPARPADLSGAGAEERRRAGWPPGTWRRQPEVATCPSYLLADLAGFAAEVSGLPVRVTAWDARQQH